MSLANTHSAYGTVSKSFHWLTALLILTLFPLGVIAENLPYDTGAQLARKAQLFSIHKSLGVIVFFVALARLLWSARQTHPGLLNADKRLEAFAAETVHFLLYLSLVLVPLSGWLHHAATEGFAPLLLPFGDNLPFVPKSEAVAHFFGAWHWVLTKVLLASLALHVAGALKHHVVDKDSTLKRMWFGKAVSDQPPAGGHSLLPPIAAIAAYAGALVLASVMGLPKESHTQTAAPALEQVQSDWTVTEGSLTFDVIQFGSPVTGSFADWTAAIRFDEVPSDDSHGSVEVTIAITSATVGSVTKDALGAEFFDAATHPTAVFKADLLPTEAEGYLAEGTLTLKGTEMPLSLPFTLTLDGDTAQMQGQTTLDRRGFGIGPSYKDESTVGFGVDIKVALTATRAP